MKKQDSKRRPSLGVVCGVPTNAMNHYWGEGRK
jgi:hypothetical protein